MKSNFDREDIGNNPRAWLSRMNLVERILWEECWDYLLEWIVCTPERLDPVGRHRRLKRRLRRILSGTSNEDRPRGAEEVPEG